MLFDVEQQTGLMGDLYTPEDKKAALTKALMSFGSSALANSGWSSTPTSLGQAIGPAISQGMTAYESGIQQAVKNALLKRQIAKQDKEDAFKDQERMRQEQERKRLEDARKAASGAVPENLREAFSLDPGTAKDAFDVTTGSDSPAAVKEFKFFESLQSPEAKQQYLDLKRSGRVVDVGGVPSIVTPGGQVIALSDLKKEIDAESDLASGKAQGKAQGEALADLPRVEQQATEMLGVIQGLREHPGLKGVVGVPSLLSLSNVPGSPEAGFKAQLAQVQGKVFLEAYQSLKGGGQITEVEGKKAEQATARLSEAQSEKEFLSALDDLEAVVRKGLERSKQQAGKAVTRQNTVNWSDL